jgi:hypothetical protein
MNFILTKTDEPRAMVDALKLVQAYHHLNKKDAILMRIRCLLKSGKVAEIQNLLRSGKEQDMVEESIEMTTTERNSICLEAIVWIFEHIAAQTIPYVLHFLEASQFLAKIVLESESERILMGIRLDRFENLYLLAKEFNLVLSPSEYASVPHKEKMLREFILHKFSGRVIDETDFHAKQVDISR